MPENLIDPEVMPTPEQAIEFFSLQPESENDPMMLYSGQDGLAVVVLNGFGAGQLGRAIERLLPRLAEEHGKPRWITICSEAYLKSYDKDFPPRSGHRPGELQDRAEAGDPTIIEVVMATGFSKDAEFSATQVFERKDGEVVYGKLDVKPPEGRVEGAIPDAIRPAFN